MTSLADQLLSAAMGTPVAASVTAAPEQRHQAPAMPAHLKRLLAQRGDLDEATGASRKARITRCPRCRTTVFLGLDEWGFVRTLDTNPLTAAGEMTARMMGVETYHIEIWAFDRIEMHERDRVVIASVPPTSNRIDVLAHHECGRQIVFERMPSVIDRRIIQPLPEEPPF